MIRSRQGLKGRLVRSYLAVIALMLGAVLALYGMVSGLLLRASRVSQIGLTRSLAVEMVRQAGEAALSSQWEILSEAVGRVLSAGPRTAKALVFRLDVQGEISSYNVFVVDRSFRVLYAYDEQSPLPDFSSGPRRRLVQDALGGRGSAVAYLRPEGRSVAACPMASGAGAPDAALCVQSPATSDFLSAFSVLLAAGGAFLLVASALSAFLAAGVASRFARKISSPLRELAEASRRIAEGSPEAPPVFRTGDEIERLSSDVHRMTLSLSTTMERLNAERQTVRALLKAKQELVANVSHDLRTPLASLKSHLEAMDEGHLVGIEEGRRYLAIVRGETDRLETLIEDLFLLTRLESAELSMQLVPVSLQELLPGLCVGFRERSLRDKGIEVTWQVTPDCPPVLADRQRLEQVLGNLLANALKYTPEGGIIRVAAAAEAEEVRLEIRDTGIGIVPEDLSRVFDRFFKGEKSRSRSDGGSGLGLSIARQLVEKQGGRIEVDSVRGEGTAFSIFLPAPRA